ncbi:MAG: YceI family protein [Ferruginibacter sp.]|nr:YceI family protein [Ferruginibacter sp.]
MKTFSLKQLGLAGTLIFTAAFTTLTNNLSAQTTFQSSAVEIRLTGTSTLHDWEMKAAQGTSEASFVVDASGKITSITKLNFSLPATSLKSDSKAMDKNTYKALNTKNHPNISFVLTSATIVEKGGNTYQLNCMGKLDIAGTIKETELLAVGKYNPADKSFTVSGIKKMKMTDYNVKPPTVMLGAIKTGNDIAISYNLKFTR